MSIKLVEVFKTKYFNETWKDDVKALSETLSQSRDAGEVKPIIHYMQSVKDAIENAVATGDYSLDIAGACCTRGFMLMLRNVITYDGIPVIDSTNEARNALLIRQAEIASNDYSPEYLPRPHVVNLDDIMQYIKDLDEDKVYKLPPGSEDWSVPMTVLVSIRRPDIKFDIDTKAEEIFAFVEPYLANETSTSYLVYDIHNREYLKIDVNADGKMYLPSIGFRTVVEAREYFKIIPSTFGVVKSPKSEGFRSLYKAAMQSMFMWMNEHKSMLSYLEGD